MTDGQSGSATDGSAAGTPARAGDGDSAKIRVEPDDGTLAAVAETLSAVRPTGVASGATGFVTALLIGILLLGMNVTVLALVAGASLAAGLTVLRSDRSLTLVFAGALLATAAALLAAALAVGVGAGLETGLAVGHLAGGSVLLLIAAGFAAVLTAVPADEEQVLADAFSRFFGLLVPLALAQVLLVVLVATESVTVAFTGLVLDSPDPLLSAGRILLAPTGPLALVTLLVYVVVVLFSFRFLLGFLPLAKLFPPRQRPATAMRIWTVRTRLGQAVLAATVATLCLAVGAIAAGVASPAALAALVGPPFGAPLVWLLTSVWLRALLLLLCGVAAAIVGAERIRRRFRRRSNADIRGQALPPLGAFAAALAAGTAIDGATTPDALFAAAPPEVQPIADILRGSGVLPAVLAAVFGSLIVVGVLFVALGVLASAPVLPERALGPAVAGASLFGLATVLVFLRGPALVAVAAAGLSLFVWDTGEFATGLREELPAGAETIRAEFVHAGGSLGVCTMAVLGAGLLEFLLSSGLLAPAVPDAELAAGAVIIAFCTTVVLLSALRK